MNTLAMQALRESDNLRMHFDLDIYEPIDIYQICKDLDVEVRFLDINMEGMYISSDDSDYDTILISSLRPVARRVFTCAHELGHHIFDHGTKADMYNNNDIESDSAEEYLVDAFAGFLLMPQAGIQLELLKRGVTYEDASPIHYYIVASVFGVGFQTLITHCHMNQLITPIKRDALLKYKPAKIFKSLFGNQLPLSHFKLFDSLNSTKTIDLDRGNFILLPNDVQVEGHSLVATLTIDMGIVYKATNVGICRIFSSKTDSATFVRIQNIKYVGLAEYRHLENSN